VRALDARDLCMVAGGLQLAIAIHGNITLRDTQPLTQPGLPVSPLGQRVRSPLLKKKGGAF
jgi:hypothetical protein